MLFRRKLVLLLTLNAFINYADRTNITVAIIKLSEIFGYSKTQIGLIFGVFTWGYGISQVISGYIATKYGSKWVLVFACSLWSIAELYTIVAADNFYHFLVCRFVLGIGEGLAFPAMHAFISIWLPTSEYSHAITMIYASCNAGNIFSLILTHYLLDWHWKSVFAVFSLFGFLWLPFWIVLSSNQPSTSKFLPLDEIHIQSVKLESHPVPWKKFSKCKAFWSLIFVHYANAFPITIMLFYLPIFLKSFDFSLLTVSYLTIIPNILQISVNVISFKLNKKIQSKKYKRNLFQLSAMIGPMICFIAFRLLESSKIISLGFLFLGIGLSSFSNLGIQSSHLDIAPKYSGLVYGLGNTAASLPGIFGLAIVGRLLEYTSWNTIFNIMMFHYAFGCFVWLKWMKTEICIE